MKYNRWWRNAVSVLGVLLVLVAILVVRSRFEAVAQANVNFAENAVFLSDIDQSEGLWWVQMGETGAVVLNLGPLLQPKMGQGIRSWSMIIHMPGTSEPLSCIQGFMDLDGVEPLGAEGEGFYVQLEPAPGFTWGEIRLAEEIVGDVEGLD